VYNWNNESGTMLRIWKQSLDRPLGHIQVEVPGFVKLLKVGVQSVEKGMEPLTEPSLYGDSVVIWFIADPDKPPVLVPFIFQQTGDKIEEHWIHRATLLLDEGSYVLHCFQDPCCDTGIMRTKA
jgi:hypothetical protein